MMVFNTIEAQRLGEFDELRQYNILIKGTDILCAAGNQHGKTRCQISRFIIAKAIEEAYHPTSVHHVFDLKRTDMELDSST